MGRADHWQSGPEYEGDTLTRRPASGRLAPVRPPTEPRPGMFLTRSPCVVIATHPWASMRDVATRMGITKTPPSELFSRPRGGKVHADSGATGLWQVTLPGGALLPGRPGRVAAQGSHRSGRAGFPHPARPVNGSHAPVHRVGDRCCRQRHPLQQSPQARPAEAALPATPGEQLPPEASHDPAHPVQRGAVPRHPAVGVVGAQFLAQRRVLLPDRSVPVPPTPLRDRLREPADPAGCRPFLDDRVVLPRLSQVMGEPQEVKRSG